MVFKEDKFSKNWKEAQSSIADFLKKNNFSVWQERRLENKRVDILAKREFKNKIFYLIFEVKHYNNVTPKAEENFLKQLTEYVKLFIKRELKRKKINNILARYHIVGYLVFSKDYGIFLNRRKNWYKTDRISENSQINNIWKKNVTLFCSSPKNIQKNLESVGLAFYSQSRLSDFF